MSRIDNIAAEAECPHCRNDAWVVVANDAQGIELMGPCPMCERGLRLEFSPAMRAKWGPDGYWQGREIVLPPQERGVPLSRAENMRRLKALLVELQRSWAARDAQAEREAARRRATAALEREQALAELSGRKRSKGLDDLMAESEAA